MAKELKVCSRTINDWRRAKYTISESSFKIILKLARQKVHIPEYKILPDFWSTKKAAKKGGKETFKRYGLLGTIESRRKGGFISQKNRLLFPERYANCNLRKHISKPQNSAYLAEFIGILLGDGHLDSFQVSITLHKKNDHIYISRVCNMVKKLFSITPAVYYARSGKRKNVAIIVVSSVLFIDFLLAKGLKRGHKVKQQVDVPGWIKKNEVFSKHCLRGLIDTDGCVYSHKHKVYGHDYLNVGINFSNKSIPILKFVYKTLIKLNFSPKIFGKGVNLYRKKEVLRYAKEIGFSNLHHKIRLDKLLEKIS
ncbi:MAG: hypothetical protein NTW46_03480 [Candidatus Nealsonbacteria bacterium]|nr:hypothetical protein [Candidatus Nealsonbacteria bacterium]